MKNVIIANANVFKYVLVVSLLFMWIIKVYNIKVYILIFPYCYKQQQQQPISCQQCCSVWPIWNYIQQTVTTDDLYSILNNTFFKWYKLSQNLIAYVFLMNKCTFSEFTHITYSIVLLWPDMDSGCISTPRMSRGPFLLNILKKKKKVACYLEG